MSLARASKEMRFDKRLIEKKIQRGEITREEYQKHLDALPDLGSKVEMISFEEQRNRREEVQH